MFVIYKYGNRQKKKNPRNNIQSYDLNIFDTLLKYMQINEALIKRPHF